MRIPNVKNRKINKVFCLVMLAVAVIFLILGVAFYLPGKNTALAKTFWMLAAIIGGYGLIFGIKWFLNSRNEEKIRQKLEKDFRMPEESDEYLTYSYRFHLPYEDLIETARLRFLKTIRGCLLGSLITFVLIYGLLFFTIGFAGFRHMALVAVFCLMIMLPGVIIQFNIYRKYRNSVPQRIVMYPGNLTVDDRRFEVHRIKKCCITPAHPQKDHVSVGAYRRLMIITTDKTYEYMLDYRSSAPGVPRWDKFEELTEALQTWAVKNQVQLTFEL